MLLLAAGLVLPARALVAQQVPVPPDTGAVKSLDTLAVQGRIDNLIGRAGTASEGYVGTLDLRSRPILREGELLETVPGVIVTQHSGEGKANQYFVRGFNLDHGTDFQTRVEGMPINMPTHGHGQGWTDLNFLIPELVDHLEYKLGVYHAELGDFGSAGGAEFHLVQRLNRPFVQVGGGQNGLARIVAAGSRRIGTDDLIVGGEAKTYDGPWEVGQNLRKFSGLARYSARRGASRFSVLALAYSNRWNASDQIPLRAVTSGAIDRFGQIEPDDGGEAQRFSLSGSWVRSAGDALQRVEVYGIHSDLDLYSNFTYFLDDATLGDQFNQVDRRSIWGANARYSRTVDGRGASHVLTAGLESRTDLIGELGLYRTHKRLRTRTVREDDVRQSSAGLYVEANSRWSHWFRSVMGLRMDGYRFRVESDRLENSGAETAGIVSPKGSLVFSPTDHVELYVSGGYGFHSNDARGTTISVDPLTGGPAERVDPLVRSRGGEVGLRAAPVPGLRSTLTAWVLKLDSELLFVGDAGVTEPTSTSHRSGVTWANFYRPLPSLAFDADLSFARARLANVPEGENHIPGALENVFAGGIAWVPPFGASGALRLRHFGSYPLVENNAVRADPATLFSGEAGYRFGSRLRMAAAVLNLLNSDAADIQYYYASRLPGEPAAGVEDVHFHPVEPRQVRLVVEWLF